MIILFYLLYNVVVVTALLTARDSTLRAGDRTARAKLSRPILKKQRAFIAKKSSCDTLCMWQCIPAITNYRMTTHLWLWRLPSRCAERLRCPFRGAEQHSSQVTRCFVYPTWFKATTIIQQFVSVMLHIYINHRLSYTHMRIRDKHRTQIAHNSKTHIYY